MDRWYDYALLLFNENHAQKRHKTAEIDKTLSELSQRSQPPAPHPAAPIGLDRDQNLETKTGEDCVVCYDNAANTVIVSCGHQALCDSCASSLDFTQCPICRTPISGAGIIRVYKC